jgi:hypothetical protein
VPYLRAENYLADAAAVVYFSDDGNKLVRQGGSRAWRNNNPGNIRYTEFSRQHGAIGTAGGFAVFPDYQAGRNALSLLLRNAKYIHLSISAAISRYAPPKENDTERYLALMARMTGLDIQRRLVDLNASDFEKVVGAIQQIEGYIVGVEKTVRKVIGVLSDGARLTAFLIDGESSYISLNDAIVLASRGEIDAVVVRPAAGAAYLRARADSADSNNFRDIAQQQS